MTGLDELPEFVPPEDVQTCQSRMTQIGPWKCEENLDRWRHEPNGDRTCSFCGSIHPDDLLAILKSIPATPDVYVYWSDKAYKLYIHRPEVTNAKDGAIKFYTWHILNDETAAELSGAYNACSSVCRERINEKMRFLRPAPRKNYLDGA